MSSMKYRTYPINGSQELTVKSGIRVLDQMVRIPADKFHRFDRRNEYDYVTIYSRNPALPGSEASKLCENLEVPKNRSLLVKQNGQVCRSYYRTMWEGGKSNIWLDESGKKWLQQLNKVYNSRKM